MNRVLRFLRREVVFSVSLTAALLSFLMASPGPHTLAGIDTVTLLMLFTLMTVVAGLRRCGVFDVLGRAVARRIHTQRGLAAALTAVCFFLAMAATNDVALITLVPFTLLLMAGARERDIILTIVLETLAANLGSMVTPIGNPQNLYLYSAGLLTLADFPRLTWPYALVSLLGLLAACRLISFDTVAASGGKDAGIHGPWGLYAVLGAVALLAVAKVLPAWAAAALVLAGTLLLDRAVLRQVDYALLGTFVCFFVFVASVKACVPVRQWLESLMAVSPLMVPLLASQVISNVPACLLLSPFTQETGALMLGVNLGGLGTLVASLASLISFKLYGASATARKGQYFMVFTLANLMGLAVLLTLAALLGQL
ncbi:MAG: SLC13 family permease [Aristaeellaceae bacterium]